jgi:hypothetical protein
VRPDHLVAELGRALGIAGLRLDDSGSCWLALSGGHVLRIRHREDLSALDLAIPLGLPVLDRDATAEVCRRLLELQLLGERTHGAAIALNEDGEIEGQRRLHFREDLRAGDVLAVVAELNGVASHLASELGLSAVSSDED